MQLRIKNVLPSLHSECNVMDLQCNGKDPVTLAKNSNELLLDFFKVTFKNDSQWERAHTGSQ